MTKPENDSNNLDALVITTLLGRGDSNDAGGTGSRDHNIAVGVSQLTLERSTRASTPVELSTKSAQLQGQSPRA